MISYCLKRRKNRKSKNPDVSKRKTERIRLLSKCAVCENQKLKLIKEKKAGGSLSSLGICTALSKLF